ncbi:MAG: ABC transporter ATP-binding protein [Bacteroidetes bacterium]|jgi:nitrate ABC transporter ATP-binding subunit|nr:ABC transporter ATP-binding protein [Bacteroidota bacterium]
METLEILEKKEKISSTGNCIEIKDLRISFPAKSGKIFTAVKDINLNIKSGEIVSIIGHSGCGKSTIMNSISGLVKPSEGTVIVNGKPVKGPGPDRGIVFQNYSLLPWFSVYRNVYEAVDSVHQEYTKAEKHEWVEKNLEMVNLLQHKDKLPSQLSGGMKQRTAIARAFAINPSVLLLDEPFGALDALTKSALHVELLKIWNLNHRKQTIVMVTHDIEEAIFLSDRVVVMNDGPEATIREIVHIPIERPRNKKEIVHTKTYMDVHDKLLSLLVKNLSIEDAGVAYE